VTASSCGISRQTHAPAATGGGVDPEGWLRLARSYRVLCEPDKARTAAGSAQRALSGDASKLQRFEDLIKPLRLNR